MEEIKMDEKTEVVKKDENLQNDNVLEKLRKKTKRKSTFFKDFVEFMRKNDIVGVAVAFVLGVSFRAIITSLVGDLIMPLFAAINGSTVSDWALVLNYSNGVPNYLYYGKFIQTIIDFLILALSIFLALRITKSVRRIVGKSATVVKNTFETIIKHDDDKGANI